MTDEALTLTTPAEIERTEPGKVRRWLAELSIADRTERDWRDEAKDLWEMYEGGKRKAHAFNILWSNTETLLPAIYNSTPQPDVRRRFRDEDAVGRAVSLVLERTLTAQTDSYDFDDQAEAMALDMLVTGRGVLRIKYEPKFAKMSAQMPQAEDAEGAPEPERLTGEEVMAECVQWDDFRHGPGKRWEEVPWIAFRHDFTQEMAEEKFGPELAVKLTYSESKDHTEISEDRTTREIFKTVEVWEIWDKDQRRVLFVSKCYAPAPLLEASDPLALNDFYPAPRPAYAIKDTRTLVPVPLYRMYKEQAKELDKVSARINKIVDALRVRGAYSANLSEIANLLGANDNEMIPVANISEIASVGGLDKAIWTLPIDKLIAVLNGLYVARDQIKQSIYEITGLSDIIRGSTDAQETASAQQLKSKWGTMRLQRLQREVSRVCRDIFRLQSEVIAERFRPETLEAATNLDFPTMAEKQQAQMMMQQAQRQAQMTGAQPPPPPPEMQEMLAKPAWEELLQIMRSDDLRQYRVDVESDSTVAETIERDMAGMKEVIESVGGIMAAVPQGLPVDLAKAISLAVVRRARLGNAVEDAIEAFEAPPPDQAVQLEGARTQMLELIKAEGAKMATTEQMVDQRTQGMEQQAAEIQGALQQIGQAAEVGLQQIFQQQQVILQQLGYAVQALEMVPAMQTTEGVVQTLEGVREGFQSVIEAVSAPKQVSFDMDKNGIPRGARLTPTPSPGLAQASAQVAAPTVAAVQGLAEQQLEGFARLAEVFTSGMQAVIESFERPKKVTFEKGADGRIKGATARVQ